VSDPSDTDINVTELVAVLVEKNWAAFAGRAWKGYLKYGRGAVLLHVRDVVRQLAGEPFTLRMGYVTAAGMKSRDGLCGTYDPAVSILVAATTDDALAASDGGVFAPLNEWFEAWRFEQEPSPPEVHKSQGGDAPPDPLPFRPRSATPKG
jgi:hypothetical protein